MSVPVLSTTSVSTASNRSSASASRTSIPARAPLPTPTMIDIGVARPSAQGQAMISTDTAATSPKASLGSGPNSAHARKASAATRTTSGTNQPATRSARRCAGARLRWAFATRSIMRASAVSRPTRSARMTRPPDPLTAPAISFAPAAFGTGIDSPVISASSTALAPSTTTPSAGTFSPGRTRSTVADGDAVEIDVLFAAVRRDAKRALRLKIEKRADGVPCPLARRQLKHLPDQYEHGDDCGGLEIDRRRAAMGMEGVRKNPRRDGRDDARQPRDADPGGDEGEHVEVAGADRRRRADEERPSRAERRPAWRGRVAASSRPAEQASWRRRDARPCR